MQYESPGDQAQAAWDAVVFHDKSSYEDVEQTLTKLNRARIKMVRAGRFVNTPDSVAREMSDIRRKIPGGSDLKRWFSTQPYEPYDFQSFVAMIRQYQSGLARPKAEAGRRAAWDGKGDGEQDGQGD